MTLESNSESNLNPYAPRDAERSTEDEFHNELLPKLKLIERLRWPLMLGTPFLFALASGVLFVFFGPSRAPVGTDFLGEWLIINFFVACFTGLGVGLLVSATVFFLTRRADGHHI